MLVSNILFSLHRCNQVDSTATNSLSELLLDALTYCSLLHNPTNLTDAVVLPLKERIINVAIAQQTPPANAAPDVLDASFQLDLLRKKIETFVEEERAKTIMNRLMTSVQYTFQQREGRKEFHDRRSGVQRCFPGDQREVFAALIIKKLDTQYQVHCDQPECGETCRFYRVPCPNEGCAEVLSRLHLPEHDKICAYKIITCQCGDHFPRHETPIHEQNACKLREAECPFHNIGCLKVIKACDLQSHVMEDAPSHLLLAVNRMSEHQDVIVKLHSKVLALEQENKNLKQMIENNAIKAKDEISKLESKQGKTIKDLSTLEAKCKKEFARRYSLKDES